MTGDAVVSAVLLGFVLVLHGSHVLAHPHLHTSRSLLAG
jgi:hypothetical protein